MGWNHQPVNKSDGSFWLMIKPQPPNNGVLETKQLKNGRRLDFQGTKTPPKINMEPKDWRFGRWKVPFQTGLGGGNSSIF